MNILYIDGNLLHGTIPTEIALMRDMEFMWLMRNDLTGEKILIFILLFLAREKF